MYDAVHLFAKALHDLDSSQRIDIKPLSCDAVDTWPHGYSLINYMKIVSILTPIDFSNNCLYHRYHITFICRETQVTEHLIQ
jgi:hypothetical protein